jgi:hypothetical protein
LLAPAQFLGAPGHAPRQHATFELDDDLIGSALVKIGAWFRVGIHDRCPFENGRPGWRGVEDANGEAEKRAGYSLAGLAQPP